MSANCGRPRPVKIVYRRHIEIQQERPPDNEIISECLEASTDASAAPALRHEDNSKVVEIIDSAGNPPQEVETGTVNQPHGETSNFSNNDVTQTIPFTTTTPHDVAFIEPGAVWRDSNVDADDDEEAPLPDAFELFEEEDENLQLRVQKHISAPLPDFYSLDSVPEDLTTLPPLEYYPLNPEVDPVRLLVILPHFGNPFSTVECNLFPVSMKEEHYCFAAVKHSRGNKHLTSHIVVNNCSKSVTRNLEVFLRHFRQKQHAMTVWIREICIDVCDLAQHRTPEWRDKIIDRACKNLYMNDFMYSLEANGILEKEKQFTVRPKAWTEITREVKLPTYFPIPLRTFTEEQMQREKEVTGKQSDIPTIPHEYLPLDLVAEEIRLIVLLPSEDPDAPVSGYLAHESLYGPTAYHCLSYTWGTGEATEDLILNGQIIKIGSNLAGALKAIRHREPMRLVTIWVDAVCINQNDVAERNRQVSRMHQIYNLSDVVLIWLGDADEDSDVAMDFVQELMRRDLASVDVVDQQQYFAETMSTEEMAIKWAALYRFLLRPYFRRLWIVQELTLASVPTAFCGLKRVGWQDIHNASLMLQLYRPQIHQIFSRDNIQIGPQLQSTESEPGKCQNCFQRRLPDIDLTLPHKLTWHREMRKQNKSTSFLYLCILNRDAECTDPRDKIYALWNLASEANELQDFRPNYSLPTRDVYIQFAKAYIEATRSLDIICTPGTYCRHGVESLDLPSWVPDWRVRSPVNCFVRPDGLPIAETEGLVMLDRPLYRAARDTTATIGFFGDDKSTLVCSGFVADTIAFVSDAQSQSDLWFTAAQKFCHQEGKPIDLTQLNRQLSSMTMGDSTCSWESDESFQRIKWVGGSLSHSETAASQVIVRPGKVIQAPIKARTFVVTKKGYMGLAPYWAQVGQELAILMGCSVPVLLQRHGNHHHVKGDCFVQGWMNGEILDAMGMTDEEVMENVQSTTQPIVIQ